jgi:cell fate regulator YaaT (PSP1 superfamily)
VTHLIEVAFQGNRKAFFLWVGDAPPPLQAPIIVEADRGEDLGRVHAVGELAERRCNGCSHGCGTDTRPTARALRLASEAELARAATLRDENESARRTTHERARAAGLVMKISDAEWQWDRRKLTLYFTAEKRVDFRNLVRDLAAAFRTRIELKQIGVRDEARRLSGVGRCGREYCSASWLPDLRPVNLGVAKDQRLSLNPTQISGACGRLMCCLRYEHEFYVQSRRRFPKEGKILRTARGEEKVLACDIFRDTVTLRSPEGDTRVVPLAALREEIGGGEADVALATTVAVAEASPGAVAFERPSVAGIAASIPGAADDDVVDDHEDADDGTDDGGDDNTDELTDDRSDDGGDDADAAAGDASTGASAPGGEPRRKRRRGRRGGRRARADRAERADRSEEPDRAERADRSEQPDRGERTDHATPPPASPTDRS